MTVTLALPKGRIFEETMPFLQAAGIQVLEDPDTSRKLILATNQSQVRVVLVRATDVPTYVSHGGADMGVVGLDTLIEHGGEGTPEIFALMAAHRVAWCPTLTAGSDPWPPPGGLDSPAIARRRRSVSLGRCS